MRVGAHIQGWSVEEGPHPGALRCVRDHDDLEGRLGAPLVMASAQEAFLLSRRLLPLVALRHPGLVPVLAVLCEGERVAVVTPADAGEPLDLSLTPPRPGWAAEVEAALAWLHAQGRAHGAVRAEHLWVTPNGRVRLAGLEQGVLAGGDAARDRAALAALVDGATLDAISVTTLGQGGGAPPGGDRGLVAGRYRVGDTLGAGGGGLVVEARDEVLGRSVALKRLGHALGGRQAVERFLGEARLLARLDHPGVVRVLDAGLHDGVPWLAMERIDGPTLQRRLDAEGPLEPGEVARLGLGMARALAHVHAAGLVHRDLKPGNVMLRDGEPVLVDFGLAVETEASRRLTRTGAVMGTPAWMPPEQALDASRVGPAGDIYALGAVLYALLSGRPPYGGVEALEVLRRVREEAPDPLPEGLPRGLAAVVHRAMAREPDQRYPSATDLAADLERQGRGEAPQALRASGGLALRRWALRHRRALRGVGLGVAVALGGLAVGAVVGRVLEARGEQRRQDLASQRWAVTGAQADAELAAGRVDEAREGVRAYLDEPANDHTLGVARAWSWWAAHEEDPASAREALGRSWLASSDTPEAREALEALVRSWLVAERWPEARATLALLAESGPPPVDLAISAALSRGATAEAAALAAAEPALATLAPVFEAFSQVTDTGHDLRDRGRVAVRGAGLVGLMRTANERSAERIVARGLVVSLDGPTLPARTDLKAGPPLRPDAGVDAAGLLWAPQLTFALDGDALRPLEGLETARAVSPRDGGPPDELGVGVLDGAVVQLLAGADGRLVVRPRLASHLAGPGLGAPGLVDLDGDGARELLLRTGPWRGNDLRLYRLPADGGPAEPWQRWPVGVVDNALPLRAGDVTLLALLRTGTWRNLFLTPADEEVPAGVELARLRDGRLVSERRIDLPGVAPRGTVVADLDGDGFDELLLMSPVRGEDEGPGLGVVLVHLRSGTWWSLPGFDALSAAQLDEDPADEVLVLTSDGRLMVIGVGQDALPDRDAALPPGVATPALRDPVVRERWEAAERMASVGLVRPAADELRALVHLGLGPEDAALAELRAAALLREDERLGDAAALARRAADRLAGEQRALALALAMDLFDGAGELERAAEVAAEVLAGGPSPEVAARATRLSAPVSRWTLDPAAPLPDAARLGSPTALRQDRRDGVVRLELMRGAGEVLRLPLERTGGPAGLRLELETVHLEWGAGLVVELLDAAGRAVARLQVKTTGGSGAMRRLARLEWDPRQLGLGSNNPQVERPERFRVALYETGEGGLGVASLESGGRRVRREPLGQPLLDGRGALSIGTQGAGSRQFARVDVRELSMWGMAPESVEPPVGEDLARRLLAEGRPVDALPLAEAAATRLVALVERGDLRGAALALPGALAEPDGPVVVLALLRRAPRVTLGLLREALGEDEALARYAEAWAAALTHHRREAWAQRETLDSLSGLEHGGPPTTAARRELLTLLAGALLETDQVERAAQAVALLEVAPPAAFDPELPLMRARLALARGDREAAVAALNAGARASADAGVFADQVRATPALTDLARSPDVAAGFDEAWRARRR